MHIALTQIQNYKRKIIFNYNLDLILIIALKMIKVRNKRRLTN